MKEEEVDVCSGSLNPTNGHTETREDHEPHGVNSRSTLTPARTVELATLIKPNEVKFSSRSRLFVGNLGNSCTVDDVRALFEQVGETSEVYVNSEKGYGILRMDYRVNAEIAVSKLHQSVFKGRQLSVRFATMASAVEVHGLGPFITDKYLNDAFSQFGVIEKATVIVDEKGKSKGYGIVEFASKKTAQSTIQKVNDGIFCLEKLPKPVSAKAHEALDDQTGVTEKDLVSLHGYAHERDCKPRFVGIDSFEYQWAQRWRVLMHNEKQRRDSLEAQLRAEREKLELEMATAVHDSEAEAMRQELMRKTEELRRHEEMRRQEEQRRQESIRQRELELRRQEDLRAQDAWRRDEARRQDEFITRQKQELEARGVPATLPTRDSYRGKALPQVPRQTSARLPLSQPGVPPLVPTLASSIAPLRTVQPPILSSPLPLPQLTPPVVSQPLPLPRPVSIQSLAPPRVPPGGPHVVTVPVPVPVPMPSGLPAPPRPAPVPPMMRPPLPMPPPRLPMDPRNVQEILPGSRRELAMPPVGPMFDAKRIRRF